MDRILDLAAGDVPIFLLAFFRISGLMIAAPVFGSQTIPPPVRIFLSLVMAVLFFPLVPRPAGPVEPNLGTYAVAVAAELSVGLLIGFAASLLFAAVQFGGQLIDQELGLMLANVLDPVTNEQNSVVGQFKLFLAILVYLAIDGHHFLVSAVVDSFSAVPVAGLVVTDAAAAQLSDAMVRDLFRIAVQIAAPAMTTLFLITVAMAFMARTVPEMNIFVLGFSLRIGVGLGVLALGVGLFVWTFRELEASHAQAVRRLVGLLGG